MANRVPPSSETSAVGSFDKPKNWPRDGAADALFYEWIHQDGIVVTSKTVKNTWALANKVSDTIMELAQYGWSSGLDIPTFDSLPALSIDNCENLHRKYKFPKECHDRFVTCFEKVCLIIRDGVINRVWKSDKLLREAFDVCGDLVDAKLIHRHWLGDRSDVRRAFQAKLMLDPEMWSMSCENEPGMYAVMYQASQHFLVQICNFANDYDGPETMRTICANYRRDILRMVASMEDETSTLDPVF